MRPLSLVSPYIDFLMLMLIAQSPSFIAHHNVAV